MLSPYEQGKGIPSHHCFQYLLEVCANSKRRGNKINEIRKKKNASSRDDNENDGGSVPHTETLQKLPSKQTA